MTKITPKTEEELKKIALDLFKEKIFTDRHVNDVKDVQMVFLPLALGALSEWEKEDFDDIGLIYEYIDKRGPRAINGLPQFMSVQLLNKEDTKNVMERLDKLKEMTA